MVLNASFNELVFENRHKEYGAYQIRKRYSKNVWLSVLFAVSIVSSCLMLYLSNMPDAVAAAIPKTESRIIDLTPPDVPRKKENLIPVTPNPPPKGIDQPDPRNVSITNDTHIVAHRNDSIPTSSGGIVGGTGSVGPTGGNPCTNCGDSTDTKKPIVSETWDGKSPTDPGIDAFFQNNIKYPQAAIEGNITGTVWLSFIVNYKGEIRDIKIIKSAHPWLDREVMRVASFMPKWIPSEHGDKSVEYIYRKPVRFKLR